MFLLIWALDKDVSLQGDNFMQLYDTLQIALDAARCQIEDSQFEDVVFTAVTDFKFGYHDVIQAWQSKHGELLLIIKMEIKNDI